jgi:hypothetical protein
MSRSGASTSSWTAASSAATTLLADGLVTISARAIDTSGNDVKSGENTLTVDNTAPETVINSGPTGSVGSTTAAFSFSSAEAGVSYECSLDDGVWSACISPKQYSGLANGLHSFRVRAIDGAGNSSEETRSWNVTGLLPNLLFNGGFESSLGGWKGSSASLALVAGGALGGKSARVSRSSGSTFRIVSSPRPVSSTQKAVVYRAAGWISSDRPGKTVCLRIREWRSGSLAGSAQTCNGATSVWHEFPSLSYAAKNSGSQLEVDVYQSGAVSGDRFQVDGLTLTR